MYFIVFSCANLPLGHISGTICLIFMIFSYLKISLTLANNIRKPKFAVAQQMTYFVWLYYVCLEHLPLKLKITWILQVPPIQIGKPGCKNFIGEWHGTRVTENACCIAILWTPYTCRPYLILTSNINFIFNLQEMLFIRMMMVPKPHGIFNVNLIPL